MSAPLTLGIDTSGPFCSVALVRGDAPVASRFEDMPRGQAERLIPMVEEVLAEAGADWSDLNRIGCCTGPGAFTGLRIAVATARGLALALSIPAVGVPRFDAYFQAALGEPAKTDSALVVISGPRDSFYTQWLSSVGRRPAPAHIMPDDPVPHVPHRAEPLFVGPPGAQNARDWGTAFVWGYEVADRDVATATAQIAGRAEAGAPAPAPLYIRPADAAPGKDAAPTLLP